MRWPEGQEWRGDALCAEIGPELFYPELGEATTEAKRACAMCPVRVECGEHALVYETVGEHVFGVWGGMSVNDRRAELRRRDAMPVGRPVTVLTPAVRARIRAEVAADPSVSATALARRLGISRSSITVALRDAIREQGAAPTSTTPRSAA